MCLQWERFNDIPADLLYLFFFTGVLKYLVSIIENYKMNVIDHKLSQRNIVPRLDIRRVLSLFVGLRWWWASLVASHDRRYC